ncbi:hypothetical protein JRO89_XSUnG0018700 [Xanthoceras sorbifolium]|uniref:Protein kinase domain-containing protein n=1 Tax=Xanthoceras sorbifolium TaxID=99658 RepID=A0ABQ8H093_9ROSI|nr:hypothetical protein JRO89_XSUnG0018700 [Xanthoceras sorbifolium]
MAAALLLSLYFRITFIVCWICLVSAQDKGQFIYEGFNEAKLQMDGSAKIHQNGLLQLTNTSDFQAGRAFHPSPIKFNTSSSLSLSFSTYFVFSMDPEEPNFGGHGMAFVIAPSMDFSLAVQASYLGLFNATNNGHSSNHILAMELDTVQTPEFQDIDGNHLGIDVNGLISNESATATYFSDIEGKNKSLNLVSGDAIEVWIDYGIEKLLNVTLAPVGFPKPTRPLLSASIDLSQILLDSVYVGFSAATGTRAADHYILGWSFNTSGQAENLDISKLPPPPPPRKASKSLQVPVIIVLVVAVVVILIIIGGAVYIVRKNKYEEIYEDWERDYGPQRISYKNLYKATKGFKDKELIGEGGFGKVYKGVLVLPSSDVHIAVKRVSHDSGEGMKQFVAEIVSMGKLRHRNLVQLRGYCRRRGELLLAYDFMPNGSLDKVLYSDIRPNLNCLPQITNVVGTVGYLAPELIRTGQATTSTDVFAFGAFMLEVACGRRPIKPGKVDLVDLVIDCWNRGAILDSSDSRLEGLYVEEQMELVLKLGLFCSHSDPATRPSMRQAVQYLDDEAKFPDIPPNTNVIDIFNTSNEASSTVMFSFSSLLESSTSHTMIMEIKFGPFEGLTRRVSDTSGGAADQGDGLMSSADEPREDDDAEEVTQVQGLGGGVETAVDFESLVGDEARDLRLSLVRVSSKPLFSRMSITLGGVEVVGFMG